MSTNWVHSSRDRLQYSPVGLSALSCKLKNFEGFLLGNDDYSVHISHYQVTRANRDTSKMHFDVQSPEGTPAPHRLLDGSLTIDRKSQFSHFVDVSSHRSTTTPANRRLTLASGAFVLMFVGFQTHDEKDAGFCTFSSLEVDSIILGQTKRLNFSEHSRPPLLSSVLLCATARRTMKGSRTP